MKFERFEEILVWQKGQELYVMAHEYFENLKDYIFKNQFLGACLSISNNIAEGFERRSNKEFRQSLQTLLTL